LGVTLTGSEAETARGAFLRLADRHSACSCCLDAEVAVTWQALLESGGIEGYLQVMAPSSLKFVGINPLGQPVIIFATDGRSFTYIPVLEGRAFLGSVEARAFAERAPSGLEATDLFFLLTGRIGPDRPRVREVARQTDGDGYWISFSMAGEAAVRHALLDPQESVLREYIIENKKGKPAVAARYGRYLPTGDCPAPSEVILSFPGQKGEITIRMNDVATDVTLFADDFQVAVPAAFEKKVVE